MTTVVSAARSSWARAKRLGAISLAVAREIFDESAYGRFLERHQLQPSQVSYAAFRKEHEHNKSVRPRCC